MLANVRVPSLVVHGADDPLVPVDGGRDTAASIPGAEEVIVPGMGHDFTEALMPEFIKHVGDFIARVESRAKAA
jgi:pimeloyl-ACP methyl ester carboxylesterase